MTTEPRASLVEVEQVDRDAAAALYLAHTAYPDAARSLVFLTGEMDGHDFVQAFARHRQEALRTQGDGEVASIAATLWRNLENGDRRMARENCACLGFLAREGRLPSWDELTAAYAAMDATT